MQRSQSSFGRPAGRSTGGRWPAGELLAVVASLAIVAALRRDHGARRFAASAAGLEGAALVVFFAMTYPVNQRFPACDSGAVPADRATLRDRWELGHAAGLALHRGIYAPTLVRHHPVPAAASWPLRADRGRVQSPTEQRPRR